MGNHTAKTAPPALIDIPDLAEMLGTSVRHIRGLVHRRELPVVKIGSKVRFRLDDINSYIESRSTAAHSG